MTNNACAIESKKAKTISTAYPARNARAGVVRLTFTFHGLVEVADDVADPGA